MPELPEVETVRRQLIKKIAGKTIKRVEVFHAKSVDHDQTIEDRLIGKTIKDIDRIGKLMIFSFTKESNLFLLAHLKMTGQFFFVEKGEISGGGHSINDTDVSEFPGRHTRVVFYFEGGSALYFNDMRLFGYTKLADKEMLDKAKSGFGPEPIDEDFDVSEFFHKLKRRNTPIKAVLLDQSFVAGLGNIYVDEALWRAKVRPEKKASRISKSEAAAIAAASRAVMLESIEVGGTTFQHFKDVEGDEGNFTNYLKVFGKQGGECERCGSTIKKIRLVGRGTHYCLSLINI